MPEGIGLQRDTATYVWKKQSYGDFTTEPAN